VRGSGDLRHNKKEMNAIIAKTVIPIANVLFVILAVFISNQGESELTEGLPNLPAVPAMMVVSM
jgi:hypothetical protein